MSLHDGGFGSAWSEAKVALGAVLAHPGRFVRFAGWQGALVLGLFAWILLTVPDGFDRARTGGSIAVKVWTASVAATLIPLLLASLAMYARASVCWFRWTVLGEDGVGVLQLRMGARELVVGATSAFLLILCMLAVLAGLLPFILLNQVLGPFDTAAYMAVMMLAFLAVGLVAVFVLGRLWTVVVSQAVDEGVGFSFAWDMTRPIAGRLFFALILIILIETALSLALSVLGALLIHLGVLPVATILSTVMQVMFLCAKGVVVARAAGHSLYGGRSGDEPDTIAPAEPRPAT